MLLTKRPPTTRRVTAPNNLLRYSSLVRKAVVWRVSFPIPSKREASLETMLLNTHVGF